MPAPQLRARLPSLSAKFGNLHTERRIVARRFSKDLLIHLYRYCAYSGVARTACFASAYKNTVQQVTKGHVALLRYGE